MSEPRLIDMHVHMVGNGGGGSGGWLRLKGWHRWLAGFMLRQVAIPASALEGDLEAIYSDHLVQFVRDSSMDAVVLLAHERVHDPDGTPRDDLGSMFVPNDVVLDLAKMHPEFLAGVSIHPARPDALDELERCLERGAVLMKCLPNCQNIDPSDRRYRRFWERMAAAGLPLLAHTGGEHTVPVVNAAFADPKLLRFPLECGVTVIAAHCGTRSGAFDHDYFGDWVAMLREFPNFYGDISAMVALNRCGHLRDCLREEVVARVLHGSDFPVPALGHRMWLQGWIDGKTFRRCQAITNPLERDWQFKLALGFPEDTATRATKLLRL
ncbi:MAG TPA: amidohydrolase family protein [Chthoniobacterales bacterium]|jgi:predicted TIM-barrel fold metal-dependent hydrolase|nr:amidohydrolase family protein [Chthoniobacterales bacterium]